MKHKRRPLTEEEIAIAHDVYIYTLPYEKIFISDALGFQKREYTTPGLKKNSGWILHLGPTAYNAIVTLDQKETFIHELMHVWQSVHSKHKLGYAIDSVCQQVLLLKFGKAYNYDVHAKWEDMHAEQQAQLVSDWYKLGCPTSDMRYDFVRDKVRTAIPVSKHIILDD